MVDQPKKERAMHFKKYDIIDEVNILHRRVKKRLNHKSKEVDAQFKKIIKLVNAL